MPLNTQLDWSASPSEAAASIAAISSQSILLAGMLLVAFAAAICGAVYLFSQRTLKKEQEKCQKLSEKLNALGEGQMSPENSSQSAKRCHVPSQKSPAELLSNMGHEIRTPMAGLIGTLTLLQKTQQSNMQAELTKDAKLSADNLMSLLNDILDMSKLEAGQMKITPRKTNLEELLLGLSSAFQASAEQKGLELMCPLNYVPEEMVFVDPIRLRQVLYNLVGNAIKFTKRGHVRVVVHNTPLSDDKCELEFVISDTGSGIPQESLESIFERFEQARSTGDEEAKGTGLGLSISNALVKAMGGSISISSKQGIGSSFTVKLTAQRCASQKDKIQTRVLPEVWLALNSPLITNHLRSVLSKAQTKPVAFHTLDVGAGLGQLIASQGRHVIFFDWASLFSVPSDQLAQLRQLQRDNRVKLLLTGNQTDLVLCENNGFPWIDELVKPATAQNDLIQLLANLFSTKKKASEPAQTLTRQQLSGSVLIVDDGRVNRNILTTYLQRLGLQTSQAENGQSALSLFEKQAFDLVFMDIQMPGMSGLEATRRMRIHEAKQNLACTPIVALTAHDCDSIDSDCFGSEFDACLTKPLDFDKINEVLESWLKTTQMPERIRSKPKPLRDKHV